MQQAHTAPPILTPTGDLGDNAAIFARHLRARNLSPRTIGSYMEAVRGLADYLAAQGMPTDLAAIRREHIEAFLEELMATRKPATAANRYRSLQQLFAWAVDEDEVKVSPMAKMKPPVVPEQPVPVLSADELHRLIAACAGPSFEDRRDEAIIRVFVVTGIRLAELAGLQWTPNDPDAQDLDLDRGTIAVLGKGRRVRVVRLQPRAIRAIDRYLRLRSRHAHAASPMLWIGQRGPLTTSGIAQMIGDRGIRAGLPGLHPHQLRHTFAHRYLAQGGAEGDLLQLAGWRSREMLSRYGASTAAERALDAAARLNLEDGI